MDLLNEKTGKRFKVNDQRVKMYQGESLDNKRIIVDLIESIWSLLKSSYKTLK